MAFDFNTAKEVRKNRLGQDEEVGDFNFRNAEPTREFKNEVFKREELFISPASEDYASSYRRPLTDQERAAAVVDLTGKPSLGQKVNRVIESPEGQKTAETVLFPPATLLDATRGILNAAHPSVSMWKEIVGSAQKGILEPNTVEPTSVAVLNAFPGIDWHTAGVLGTAIEFSILNPWAIKTLAGGVESLGKEAQFTQIFNRMRESDQWKNSVEMLSEKVNAPMDIIDQKMQQYMWGMRNKTDYWKLLGKNIEFHTGIDIFNERGFANLLPEGEGAAAPAKIPAQIAGDRFIDARIKQLIGEANSISKQMELLEKHKSNLEAKNLSSGHLDLKLEKLQQKFDYADSSIAELMITKPTLDSIRKEQGKVPIFKMLQYEKEAANASFESGKVFQKYGEQVEKTKDLELKFKKRIDETKQKFAERVARQKKADMYRGMFKDIEQEMVEGVKKDFSALIKESKDTLEWFKNLDVTNLPLDYQRRVDSLTKNFDFESSLSLDEKNSLRQFIEKQKETGEPISVPQEIIDSLEKVSPDSMTIDDLRNLRDHVKQLIHLGRLKGILLSAKGKREVAGIVANIVDGVTKGQGLSENSAIIQKLKTEDKAFANTPIEGLQNLFLENLRPELILNMLDDYNQDGPLTKHVWDVLNTGRNNKLVNSERSRLELEKLSKAFLKKGFSIKTYKIGRFTNITKNEAVEIYAHSFNTEGLAHLTGTGITKQDIQAISDFLTDSEKGAVHDLFNYYEKSQGPRVKAVYEAVEGMEFPQVNKYFPIMGLEQEEDPLKRMGYRRPSVTKGFTKERVKSKAGFKDFGFLEAVWANHEAVEHYIAFEKAVKDAAKILLNPDVKKAIQESKQYGPKTYSILETWLKHVSQDGARFQLEWYDRFSKWIRTNYGSTVFGFNMSVMAKQFGGIFQGMQMAGKTETVKAIKEGLSNPAAMKTFIDSKSAIMKYRGMRQEREFVEIMRQRNASEKLEGAAHGWRKFKELSLVPTQVADKLVAYVVWMGSYNQALKDGVETVGAAREADRAIRRTQPMGDVIDLPHFFRGNEVQKLLTFAQSHVNKFFNLQVEMGSRLKRGVDPVEKALVNALFFTLLPAMYILTIDKKRLPNSVTEVLEGLVEQTVAGFTPLSMVAKVAFGKSYVRTTPIENFWEDYKSIFKAKHFGTKVEALAYFLAETQGAPTVQLRRLIKGKTVGEKIFGKAPSEGGHKKGMDWSKKK